MKHAALTLTALVALSACGGGGGGDSGPVTVFTYQTFDSDVPGTSDLRATGLTLDAGNVPTATDNLSGTLDRQADAINIAGLIVDNDGRDGDTWSNGTITVSPASTSLFGGNYDFLLPVVVTDSSNPGGTQTYLIGVASRFQDLPAGSATYTGQSLVSGIIGGGGAGSSEFQSEGDLNLTVAFGNDTLDVIMSDLGTDGAPFETIRLDDLRISNGGGDAIFADDGSSSFAFIGGTNQTPVGASETLDATGSFFGGDENGPLEAGGTFVIEGDDGVVFGVFVADNRN